MTVLPSPIPHPLDFSPWELPGWIYEALDWVVGVEWPDGNERAVWDLADQWYGVAAALAGPQTDAVTAATEVRSGYGGVGAVATAFDEAWHRVAEGDDAPLPVLLAISTDLGRLVEECGCDIEGAKLEVWIELGILVVELLGLAVATVLTAGAASPAAAAAIAATRAIVQQIFKRLMAQLARKALKQGLKEAGERAAKEVTKGGMRGLARRAAAGGLYEAGEEAGVSLATQAYQNSTGRRHGLDLTELGTSAVGGLAGGAVAPLAGLGRHATGRGARIGEHVGREMTGEVLAEQAASLAIGQGPTSLEDAARAAASGVRGSATTQADAALQARLDGRMSALAGLPTTPADLRVAPSPELSAQGGGVVGAGPALDGGIRSTVPPGPDVAPASRLPEPPLVGDPRTVQAGSTNTPQPSAVDPVGAGVRGGDTAVGPDATPLVPQQPGPAAPPDAHTAVLASVDTPSTTSSQGVVVADANVTSPYRPSDNPTLTSAAPVAPTPNGPVTAPAPPTVDGLSSAAGPTVTTSGPPTSGSTAYPINPTAGPTAFPATAGPTVTAAPSPPVPTTSATTPTDTLGTAAPRHPTEAVTPRTGLAAPAPPPPPPPPLPPPPPPPPPPADAVSGSSGVGITPASGRGGADALRPRTPEWYAAQWAADRDAFERRRYRGYYESQRERHEEKRRFREVARLRALADEHYRRAHEFAAQALRLRRAGLVRASHAWQEAADEATQQYGKHFDEAEAVLSGTVTPVVVEVGKEDFRSINDDVGDLTLGAVDTGNRSALTGDDDPPPIDHSRRYGVRGGLRPPLALHQTDVERQMPRHPDGGVVRTADPRRGGWFRLMNDGGPQADPTRGINCLDCTLSLFDTWVHGRPRVAAPRTFDAYENGNVTRPLDGEANGPARIEDVTGGRFQRLCAPGEGRTRVHPKHALDAGYRNLHDQLVIGGHGSFAFVINQWEGGGSHIWVALNQNGTVLYLDPQSGEISDKPLGGHRGHPHARNAIDADVLILGPDARPMPLAGLRRGLFSQRPNLPEYPPAREHQGYGEPYLNRMHLLAGPGSAEPTPHVSDAGPSGLPESRPDPAGRSLSHGRSGHQTRDVLMARASLDEALAAGGGPIEWAAQLKPSTVRTLAPSLNEADAQQLVRFFREPQVQRMLDRCWQERLPGEPGLASTLIWASVGRPDLVRVMLRTPELLESLTARPVTFEHLAEQGRAVAVLGEVLDEIERRGVDAVAQEVVPGARPVLLADWQREISERLAVFGRSPVQAGFDTSRRHDDLYRSEYVRTLYVAAVEAQQQLNHIARKLAGERGKPGWRVKPKDRDRVGDKLLEYDDDASRLKDLAAAKVEFLRMDDVYRALLELDGERDVVVVGIKDRFLKPQKSGYRDVLLNLELANGHIGELRLHLAGVEEVARWEHALYQVRRDLDSLAGGQDRPLSSGERALRNALTRRGREAYQQALDDSGVEQRHE
ncbi:toxin glutamine deamidase domain-containing protein [Micromonospora sp. BQ11]|uniref:toxin glutamine deamidase domain-containing protein n=1 Tax=Micromonospora sp. BQ11 TaxID=3452212 RepID=UPI003F8AC17E